MECNMNKFTTDIATSLGSSLTNELINVYNIVIRTMYAETRYKEL